MDIKLISGPNNSGKSLYAETLAVANQGCPLIYLATMIPQTEDNFKRIEKHKLQRKGKGFTVIEEPWNIHTLTLPKDAVVLLEDASNLLANGIFVHHSDVEECYQRILALANNCRQLIIVSIANLAEGAYDDETNRYIKELNMLNTRLERISSQSIRLLKKNETERN